MGVDNIEKRSWRYALLKAIVAFWHNNVYYRRVDTINTDKVPKDVPVIFAPNHQNALMDAMAVLLTRPGQPVFLARSDIFKNKTIARILTFLKILPVYRIRDGYASLRNNEEIFRKTIDVLENNNGLVVLPEGNHAPFRRLRILKKGISRLAFQAAEKFEFKKDIKIVPVGIDYSDYYKFRQKLTVNYGEPISLSTYYSLYRENPNKAVVELIRELSGRMKMQIINIEDQDHYDTINQLRILFEGRIADGLKKNIKKPLERLESQQEFVTILDEYIHRNSASVKDIDKEVQAYVSNIQQFRLRSWVLNKHKMTLAGIIWRLLGFILLSPFFLYGLIFNWLPYKVPVWIGNGLKDPVFVSSFKFVISLLLFPIFYVFLALLFLLLSHSLIFSLIYLVSLPISGIFAFQYYIAFKKFRARWRYSVLTWKHNPDLQDLELLHVKLGNFIDNILNKA